MRFFKSDFTAPSTTYPYYELPNLEQGSDEWRKWRKRVIGASDAPTIMGENRWQSANYLLEEKLGFKSEFTGNAATREGTMLEATARKLLEKKFRLRLKSPVIQDGKIPYLAASLDGIDQNHTSVFEIKCGAKAYEIVASQNAVPSYYYGQLQHILMITQLDLIIYGAYRPNRDLLVLEVPRDDAYISSLRDTEKEFAVTLRGHGHKLQNRYLGKQISRP